MTSTLRPTRITPPSGPISRVVLAYGRREQTRTSMSLPNVPTTLPVRSVRLSVKSPIKPKLGSFCCSPAEGPSGAIESDVQLNPATSTNARASDVRLRDHFIVTTPGAKGERQRPCCDLFVRRTERAPAEVAWGRATGLA